MRDMTRRKVVHHYQTRRGEQEGLPPIECEVNYADVPCAMSRVTFTIKTDTSRRRRVWLRMVRDVIHTEMGDRVKLVAVGDITSSGYPKDSAFFCVAERDTLAELERELRFLDMLVRVEYCDHSIPRTATGTGPEKIRTHSCPPMEPAEFNLASGKIDKGPRGREYFPDKAKTHKGWDKAQFKRSLPSTRDAIAMAQRDAAARLSAGEYGYDLFSNGNGI